MITSLDHVAVVSRHADALFGAYQRLGFALTPLSMHVGALGPGEPLVPWGTGNRCAMFRLGYLELIGIVDAARPCGIFPELLQRYEGLHIIAYGCSDAEAEMARLESDGVDVQGIVALQRELSTPDGTDLARFSLVRLAPEEAREGRLNIIQHHTPDLLWQPRQLEHPNRAVALVEVTVCVADADEAAGRYSRILGVAANDQGPGRVFDLPQGRLRLVAPDELGDAVPGAIAPTLPFIAAFTIATESLDSVEEILVHNDVEFERENERVVVARDVAQGAVCLFEPA